MRQQIKLHRLTWICVIAFLMGTIFPALTADTNAQEKRADSTAIASASISPEGRRGKQQERTRKKQQRKQRKKEKQSRVKNPQPVPEFEILEKRPGDRYIYFIAIGDQGTGEPGQHRVARLMSEKALRDSLHFVLTLGDNIYDDGVRSANDPQWKTKFEEVYNLPGLDVPFYPTLGNHDYHKNRAAFQVAYARVNPKWKMPAKYYTFTRPLDREHTVQFFALDTTPLVSKDTPERQAQLQWLERELQASTATWKIAFGHHPVFSYGEHGHESRMIRDVRPLFEKYDVDLYICGHDHDRQLLKPVAGVHYVVSGTGAKSRDTEYGPLTVFAATNLGFVYFRLSHHLMHLQFIDGEGRVEFAHTWEKGEVVEQTYTAAEIGGRKIKAKQAKKRRKQRSMEHY